jgi:urease accessory protein
MLRLHTRLERSAVADVVVDGELTLPYELREKSRLRATLNSGEEVAVFMQRGSVLRNGDLLRGDDGRVVRVWAAPEATCRVECRDAGTLLRCAFHLGNRHTQVQVAGTAEQPFMRIRQDIVLKEMLEGVGATVTSEDAPFEPESGAYGDAGGGHAHGHGHGHDHSHSHPSTEATQPRAWLQSLLAPVPLRQKIHRPSDREAEPE